MTTIKMALEYKKFNQASGPAKHHDTEATISQPDQYTNELAQKKLFFIFGHNISHSLSPTLHNSGFKSLGLPHHYQIHESEQVDHSVEAIINRLEFGGASVTFPHKLQIGRFLHTVSPIAEKVGAVNTVIVRETAAGGKRELHGDNTDWIGIKRCVERARLPNLQQASTALVLGAGGAARAACYAVERLGISQLIIVNRTLSKAEEMASSFPYVPSRVVPTLEEAAALDGLAPIRLIVGCVPADDLGEHAIPKGLFSRSAEGVLVEMAYRPQVTGMMTVAGKHPGWAVFRGVDVLEEQAFAQFELWMGQQAPVDIMRAAVQSKLKANM